MPPPSDRARGRALLWLALAALPPLLALHVVLGYGVDLLRIDDWSLAWLFTKIERGTLSFGDLVAQHNEIRPLFPRLALIGLAQLGGYDARHAMGLSLALCAAVSACLYAIGRRTLGGPPARALLLLALVNPLVFSPVNAPNWLWAVQIVMFLTLACLAGGLALAAGRLPAAARWPAAALLCGVATYSMSAGVLCWLAVGAALWAREGDRRARRAWGGLWLGAMAACFALYFTGYARPDSLPSPWRALGHPLDALAYLLAYLGGPFCAPPADDRGAAVPAAVAFGALLVGLLGTALATLVRRRDGALWRRAAPWLALAGFALASGALAAVGRSGFGTRQALAPRYATWALHLPVALVYLGAIARVDARDREPAARPPRLARAALALAIALLVGAHGVAAAGALRQLEITRERHLAGRALLAFINVVPEPELLARLVFPWVDRLAERANALDRQGLLRPPLVASDRVRALAGERPETGAGALERHREAGDALLVAGWAVLPRAGRPADAVLLCATGPDGEPRVIAVSVARRERPDVVAATGDARALRSGFAARVPRARIPEGATALTAWAFDALDYRAYELDGSVPLAHSGSAKATSASPRRVPPRA